MKKCRVLCSIAALTLLAISQPFAKAQAPWPVSWYYTDVYVDYIDGEYFLFNPYYPGVRVGINVII